MVHVVVTLLIMGLLLWAAEQLFTDATLIRIVRVVVIVCAVFYVLQAFHLLGSVRLP